MHFELSNILPPPSSAAVESTGQAKAEAQSRAESQRIEGQAAVEQAQLKAQAGEIEAVSFKKFKNVFRQKYLQEGLCPNIRQNYIPDTNLYRNLSCCVWVKLGRARLTMSPQLTCWRLRRLRKWPALRQQSSRTWSKLWELRTLEELLPLGMTTR